MARAIPILLVVTLALVLVLAGCSGLSRSGSQSADLRVAVDSLFYNYAEALNRADSTAILEAYAPSAEVTVAGREQFFHGPGALSRTAGENLALGQNTFEIDTLEVVPIEAAHALALVTYTVDPSDQDVPAFHVTGTYLLEKSGAKWKIMHAHVCPAREL